jgi:DNA-binding NtrC family response regulator
MERSDVGVLSKNGKETILLVDDEPSLLETGQELLTLSGFHVLTAACGEDALEILARESGNISLVILDLMMPGMGGQRCLPEILKIVPGMKLIIASGYVADLQMMDMFKIGAVDFIQKPYHIEELNRKIRAILDQAGPSS